MCYNGGTFPNPQRGCGTILRCTIRRPRQKGALTMNEANAVKAKTIKLNYCGVGEDFDKTQNLLYDVLRLQGYDVQITQDPDYLLCEFSGDNPYPYCGTSQVRIMYSAENYIPDFNLIDYAICPYPISFGDRNFCLPVCVWPRDHWHSLADKPRSLEQARALLGEKTLFANFIASHESEFNLRGDFFQQLCAYKQVSSPGTYLNNMPGGLTVDFHDESKTNFQRRCKFTLCFESTCHFGFVTEKIMDAFYADTIPVYYGSPTVTSIFNRDAFINIADFPSFDAAIQRIIQLDQDDEAYVQMLSQPVLVDPGYPARLEAELGAYIRHIFDQPLDQAYRRSRVYHPKAVDDYLSRAVDSESLTMANLLRRAGGKALGRLSRR